MIPDLNEYNIFSIRVYEADPLKGKTRRRKKIRELQTTKFSTASMVVKSSMVFPTICRR